MPKNAPREKPEKFYFHLNIFDEKEEPEEPPPPMFSAGELEDTRQKAYAEGKAAGLKESADLREQHVARMLEKISKEVMIIYAAETAREKAYEREAVQLALCLFRKAFPLYLEKFGEEDLKRHLESILRKQEAQKQILIHVTPVTVDGIRAHLATLKSAGLPADFSVQGDETLAPGACRLSWADGGAVRSAETLAAEVETVLKDLLAGTGAKVHDD